MCKISKEGSQTTPPGRRVDELLEGWGPSGENGWTEGPGRPDRKVGGPKRRKASTSNTLATTLVQIDLAVQKKCSNSLIRTLDPV